MYENMPNRSSDAAFMGDRGPKGHSNEMEIRIMTRVDAAGLRLILSESNWYPLS